MLNIRRLIIFLGNTDWYDFELRRDLIRYTSVYKNQWWPWDKIKEADVISFLSIYIYIYIYIRGACDRFPDIFRIGIYNRRRLLKIQYVIAIHLKIFMISVSNEQLHQQLEYTLLKPNCHSWWISKMQFETLEERYAIKFCFKPGKMPQKRLECFRLLLEHLVWIEHQFLSCIRDSTKAGRLWGMMRGVGGVSKSIRQSWLPKGLGLLCWAF